MSDRQKNRYKARQQDDDGQAEGWKNDEQYISQDSFTCVFFNCTYVRCDTVCVRALYTCIVCIVVYTRKVC